MTATIPNLWPEGIKVDVLPPVTILKYQATKIREMTKGILECEVTTVTGPEDFVSHRLDLIAPVLDGRRQRVLTATHRADLYPVVVEADCFRPKPKPKPLTPLEEMGATVAETLDGIFRAKNPPSWPNPDDWRPIADDQDELLKRIGEVLKSRGVRSTIDSMIALSNDKQQANDATQPAA